MKFERGARVRIRKGYRAGKVNIGERAAVVEGAASVPGFLIVRVPGIKRGLAIHEDALSVLEPEVPFP